MAHIQAQKGQFSYASSGNGTPQHLTGELFNSVQKLKMTHVPYKGSAPAISDLLGGHVPMMFDSTIAIMPHIKSGKVRPIAISSAKRSPLLPDVPTFAELGIPAVESYAWYGLFAPAKTPKAVITRSMPKRQVHEVAGIPEDPRRNRLGRSGRHAGKLHQVRPRRIGEMVEGGEGKRRDGGLIPAAQIRRDWLASPFFYAPKPVPEERRVGGSPAYAFNTRMKRREVAGAG
jgi:hypothetical protein